MAQGRAISTNLSAILASIEKDLDGVQKGFLKEVAEDLVQSSPVWSGRYVTSHSIGTRSSAGQFTGSFDSWTEKTSVPEAYRAEARANLLGNIAALPPLLDSVYLSNNAPHANIVEHGSSTVRAHKVYEGVLNRANIHLQNAINKVKGGQ